MSGGEGYIRLNVKGRERDGCLAAGDVPAYAKWLSERLLEIRVTQTREPLITDIIDVGATHTGTHRDYLPDLVLKWGAAEPATSISSPWIGTLSGTLTTGRGGNHTPDAFALYWGRRAGQNVLSSILRIEDLHRYPEAILP